MVGARHDGRAPPGRSADPHGLAIAADAVRRIRDDLVAAGAAGDSVMAAVPRPDDIPAGANRGPVAARADVDLVAPGAARDPVVAGARALLDRAPGITAVFAFSDPLAYAARLAARERGLSVPGDLSIIGFDDTAPPGEGLTTIHQPLRDKGRIAAERLLRALGQDPPPARGELLPTRLVVRDSTAPPAGE